MLRGRGGCYKHAFYGIESHRCMEATPSLACANKCVFCWRHHTNPGDSRAACHAHHHLDEQLHRLTSQGILAPAACRAHHPERQETATLCSGQTSRMRRSVN